MLACSIPLRELGVVADHLPGGEQQHLRSAPVGIDGLEALWKRQPTVVALVRGPSEQTFGA